jgi:hypothetical protein
MTSRFLPVIAANALVDLHGCLGDVVERRSSFERMLVFCRNYRRRGICHFFLQGRPTVLHQDLQRSGAAFAYYLSGASERDKATGKSAPFFDAIACGDMSAATRISNASRHGWNREEEYEDDFLYVAFLMARFFPNGERAATGVLGEYERVLEGAPDARFTVCTSLQNGDGKGFEDGLQELLVNRREYYREGVRREEILEEDWATEGQLFVEGVALVRLATIAGLDVQRNFMYIPSLIFKESLSAYEESSWQTP